MEFIARLVVNVLGEGAIRLVRYPFEKQRTEKLKKVSKQIGLAFYPKPVTWVGKGSLMERLSQFHLFSEGHNKEIINMLHGQTQQAEVAIFGYKYTTGGQNRTFQKQTVIYFHSSSLNLPRFALRPENLFHKIGEVFGYQDIDFESHPIFSQNYLLRADDEQGVRFVFSEQVLSYFEKQRGVSTEGGGDQLIFYRPGKRIDPDQVRPFMEEGFRGFELFKQ